MSKKSKFFRVAVEGMTASDGRTIERQWLVDIAESYNPETFGARVNMEHIKGFSAEGPFIAYGDVLAVKTEEVEIELAGKKEKRLALFAQIDPTDQLVKFNKARQKIYSSIEIEPNFSGTGRCYLMGLAVTDNPASLGTEALKFSASGAEGYAKQLKAALDSRKQHSSCLFTALVESTIDLEGDDDDDAVSAFEKVFGKFSAMLEAASGRKSEPEKVEQKPAKEALSDPNAALAAAFSQFGKDLGAQLKADRSAAAAAETRIRSEFAALKADIEKTPDKAFTARPEATGADGVELADC